MNIILRVVALSLVLLASAARAQSPVTTGNTFVTSVPGKTVVGYVQMCLDATSKAVPCASASNGFSVTNVGADNIATPQVTVATTSTPVVAARPGRRAVTVTNITGTQPLFCTTGTATLTNGQFIAGSVGANFTFPFTGALNCISQTAAQTVSVTETY